MNEDDFDTPSLLTQLFHFLFTLQYSSALDQIFLSKEINLSKHDQTIGESKVIALFKDIILVTYANLFVWSMTLCSA